MLKIRKGDTVEVIKGKDKGKRGKVLSFFGENNRAIVEGINFVKKHKRKTREDQQAGIVSIESPISIANIMLVCKNCNHATRVGFSVSSGNAKSRVCKSCNQVT